MIIVKLLGGLGNQMFQYAAGKALALKHHVDVKVDLSMLQEDAAGRYTQRFYELEIFHADIAVANEQDLAGFSRADNLFGKILKRTGLHRPDNFTAVENGSDYDVRFNTFPANTYLNGYWQSERYFVDYSSTIRADFKFRDTIVEACRPLVQKVEGKNVVSLHVRRGDYVSNTEANAFHGLCSPAYYEAAVKHIAELHGTIEIVVFSDDIPWCRENLTFPFPTHFFDTGSAAEDMYLMSCCRHHIIANSSFSWWGAWLNDTPGKTVVAPKTWFAGNEMKDIIPSTWTRL